MFALHICHSFSKSLLIGWYPEVVFLTVVFSNSTNLAVMILNSSALKIYFVNRLLKTNSETYLHLISRQNPQFNLISVKKP